MVVSDATAERLREAGCGVIRHRKNFNLLPAGHPHALMMTASGEQAVPVPHLWTLHAASQQALSAVAPAPGGPRNWPQGTWPMTSSAVLGLSGLLSAELHGQGWELHCTSSGAEAALQMVSDISGVLYQNQAKGGQGLRIGNTPSSDPASRNPTIAAAGARRAVLLLLLEELLPQLDPGHPLHPQIMAQQLPTLYDAAPVTLHRDSDPQPFRDLARAAAEGQRGWGRISTYRQAFIGERATMMLTVKVRSTLPRIFIASTTSLLDLAAGQPLRPEAPEWILRDPAQIGAHLV